MIFTKYRFDLLAKYIYATFYLKNIKLDWVKELYKQHVLCVYGQKKYLTKDDIDTHMYSFEQIIKSIKINGFIPEISVIPTNNGELCGGSLRIIACYLLNKTPVYKNVTDMEIPKYNYQFFFKQPQYGRPYLKIKHLDYMAMIFIKLNPRCKIILTKDDNVIEDPIYHKSILLTRSGYENLQDITNFDNTEYNKWLSVYVVEPDVKSEYWETNNYEQTLFVGQLFLNDNSLCKLNKGTYRRNKLVENYKYWLLLHFEDTDDFIILDITDDVIQFTSIYELTNFDNLPKYMKYVNMKENSDLIYNSDNYYYLENMKVKM